MKKIFLLLPLIFALISIACQSATMIEKAKVEEPKIDPIPIHISTVVEQKTNPAQIQNYNVVEQKTDLTQIQNSTLLIVVEDIQKSGVTLAYDLGTVVQYQGEKYLVTHNHWGDMLRDMNILEIRDAQFKMLRTMYASAFKKLVVYQDAGTMVLHLPDGLPDNIIPVDLVDTPQLNPGDTVQVAHWSYPNRDQLVVSDAIVEEISTFKEEPVYSLRSLDGQPLHPGDSGGGVWHNGKLVANTWTVLTTYETIDTAGTVAPDSETLTDLSKAAIFPEEFK
jgi:hypothetical protein